MRRKLTKLCPKKKTETKPQLSASIPLSCAPPTNNCHKQLKNLWYYNKCYDKFWGKESDVGKRKRWGGSSFFVVWLWHYYKRKRRRKQVKLYVSLPYVGQGDIEGSCKYEMKYFF